MITNSAVTGVLAGQAARLVMQRFKPGIGLVALDSVHHDSVELTERVLHRP